MAQIDDLNYYIFGLHAVIGCVAAAVIIVFYSFKVEKVEGISNSYFQAYLLIGVIGWFGTILRDAGILPVDMQLSAAGYVIANGTLLFALYEYVRRKVIAVLAITAHLMVIGYSFNTSDYTALFLSMSYYGVIFSFIVIIGQAKKAMQTRNVGYSFIAFAALIVFVSSVIQINILKGTQDFELTYGFALIHSAIGFIMVGLGFGAILLFDKQKQLTNLALYDPLTGLMNRRGMDFTLAVSLNSAKRFDKCLSAIAVDIDFFKKINDTYGHDGGDVVLVEIGKLLSSHARSGDISCRFGGEEFIIALPDTESENAIQIAERMRQEITELQIEFGSKMINLSASFGVATHCGDIDVDYLLKDADKALYKAKETGRNKVCHSNEIEHCDPD